jgi:hypothetical protein
MAKDNKKLFGALLIGGILILMLRKKPSTGPAYKNNAEHLNSLNPKFRYTFKLFIKRAEDLGYKAQINSSYRDYFNQARQKKADNRNASPNYSLHNYGMAIDVQFYKGGKWLNKNASKNDWINSGIVDLANKLGLDWGGNISGYPDKVHFFVRGLDPNRLYSEALKQFKGIDPKQWKGNTLKIA